MPAFALEASLLAMAGLVLLVFCLFASGGTAPAVAATSFPVPEERARERDDPEPPPTAGERAVRIALRAVGVPYRYGGESPESGFDCSGLVRWAYGRIGIDLPHNSYALYSVGRSVPRSRMEPGDVLFFEGLGHVGLYLGRGRMVHAPQTGRDVEVVRLGATNYGERLIGARRMAPA
jgi:cell wall-associated NlpC family hydrolase